MVLKARLYNYQRLSSSDWKRIDEDSEGVVSIDTILQGVCD